MDKTELMNYIHDLAYVPVYEEGYFDIEFSEGMNILFFSSENPKKIFFLLSRHITIMS